MKIDTTTKAKEQERIKIRTTCPRHMLQQSGMSSDFSIVFCCLDLYKKFQTLNPTSVICIRNIYIYFNNY